jgi:uncharacterized membrane protein
VDNGGVVAGEGVAVAALCHDQGMNTGSPFRRAGRIRRSRLRFAVMLLAGLLAATAAGLSGHWVQAPAVGWSSAALIYTVWVWLVIGRLDPAETRSHATAEDPARGTTDLLILAANVASLAAVAAVVVDSHSNTDGASRLGGGLLALASVALSWMLVQTLFTLRYAQLYYSTGRKAGAAVGGIDFNQSQRPQYTDFAYLATSLGMTYQVSDTALENHGIRAEALKHSLLSYLFGTIILAATINLVIGLAA